MDEFDTPVTDEEPNPGGDDSQPDESFDEATPSDPPVTQPTSDGPDAAYKGLQRVLEKEKAKSRDLEARLQQAKNQPQNGQSDAIIQALIGEIIKVDPERGNQLYADYRVWAASAENQRLRNQSQEDEQARIIRQAEERNMEELRAIAADLGADPDSPSIDYGDSNEWIAERITKVRASAKAAAKPVKPVTPAKRTVDETHNTQPGAPVVTPKPNTKSPVTEAMVQAAQAEYARAFLQGGEARAQAEAKLNDLTTRLADQLFST